MQPKSIEWPTFLKMCGSNDRAILTGEERMKYSDFLRFAYITDFLGMPQINKEIWSRFSPHFAQRLAEFQKMTGDPEFEPDQMEVVEEAERCEEWVREFIRQIRDTKIRRYFWGELEDS